MENKYITIKQAATILGVSPLTLRNWDKSGKFIAARHPINNYRVYKTEDLEDLIMQIGITHGKRIANRDAAKKLIVQHLSE
jgi:DNA-binding transcriptional MerR regulator